MADELIKSNLLNYKKANFPNKKTYYSLCNSNRRDSSVPPDIKLTKYKNEIIRKIEDFINKENASNIENEPKTPSVANEDIMRFREKRASSYLEMYQNQNFFSKNKKKIECNCDSNLNSLNIYPNENQSTNYIENENYFREHEYFNMHFNKKYQANSASINNSSNILLEKKQKQEIEFLEFKSNLNQIFIENSSFNKSKNEYLMSYSKIVKLIHSKKITYSEDTVTDNNKNDSDSLKQNEIKILELNDLDLLIHNLFRQKKLYFTFGEFIRTVEKVCELIYSEYEEKPKDCLVKFTKEFFMEKENNGNTYTIKEKGNVKRNFSIDLREDVLCQEINNNDYLENDHKYMFKPESNKMQRMEKFILEFKFDIKIKIILMSILETLVKLYKFYFYFEVNKFSDRLKIDKNSFNALMGFCSDFDLIPYDLSFEQLSIYWNLVTKSDKIKSFLISRSTILFRIEDTNDPDLIRFNAIIKNLYPANLGIVFSFSNFCIFLIHISQLTREKEKRYKRTNTSFNYNVNQDKDRNSNSKGAEAQINFDNQKSEKFLFLLEKLNRSKGFVKFEEKLCLAFNAKYSLLPPVKVINLIIPSLIYYEMLESERAKQIQEIKNFKSIKRNSTESKNNDLNLDVIEKLKASNGFSNCIIEDETEKNNELENLHISSLIPIEGKLVKNLRLKLNDIKQIFDFYSSQHNSFVVKNNNRMIFIAFYKFLEDNDLIINKNKESSDEYVSDKNSNFEVLNQEYKNSFNKPARRNKEYKLDGQDVINIFSELVSIKNINFTNTTKNLITEASSKKDFDRSNKEKEIKIKNDIKFSTIDFALFIKSFEYLALKIFFNKNVVDGLSENSADNVELLNKSMDKFINWKIPSIIKNYNLKKFLIEKSIDKDEIKQRNMEFVYQNKIQRYLKEISYLLIPFYKLYSNKQNHLLEVGQYIQFFKEFSIYPDLVNCNILKQIFHDQVLVMNQIQMEESRFNKNLSSKGFNEIEKNNQIDFKGFVNCIAMASQYIKYDVNSNSIQKLIFLLERIHQSNGLKKAMIELALINNKANSFGNYLDILIQHYPDFYEICFPSPKNKNC